MVYQPGRTIVFEHNRRFFTWRLRNDPPTRVVGPVLNIPNIPLARILPDDEAVDDPIHSLVLVDGGHIEEMETRLPRHTHDLRSNANDGRSGLMFINVLGCFYQVLVGAVVPSDPRVDEEDSDDDVEVGQCCNCNDLGPIGNWCHRDACEGSFFYDTRPDNWEDYPPRSDDSL